MSESGSSVESSDSTQSSELSEENGDSKLSVTSFATEDGGNELNDDLLRSRLSLDEFGAFFSLKETFTSLCIAFRDSCNYDLLAKAERMFAEPLNNSETWRTAYELSGKWRR